MENEPRSTIQKWIERRGSNINRVAQRAKVKRGTIYNLINKPGSGRISTYEKIAKALDVTVSLLFCDPDSIVLDEPKKVNVSTYGVPESRAMTVAEPQFPARFSARFVTGERQFSFRLDTTALEGYKAGDLFLIDPDPSLAAPGNLVLASIAGADANLYRYQIVRGRIRLTQGSEAADEGLVAFFILGVAIALERGKDAL